MADLYAQLEEIVRRRKGRLPWVDDRLERLAAVEDAYRTVLQASADLPTEWLADPGVRDAIDRLTDGYAARAISDARGALTSLQARFSRETVNVGVCGRARVGKSAMLQSVSGLGENQVPTGEASNVTAVRSRIFHASRQRALIRFHTKNSFMDEVVRPYFADLEISPAPTSIELFLSAEIAEPTGQTEQARLHRLWSRLKAIQRATPRLRLDGGELILDDLTDLRRYVAYETTDDLDAEDRGTTPAPRDYLSVVDCRIEAPFPVTAVNRLGLVDLPGLGEVAAGIEDRIVNGLRGEVDAVLLVLRASVGLTNIDQIDLRVADLISSAQGSIAESSDFAWVVINAGAADAERARDLRSQVQRQLNRSNDDSRYIVATANAKSPESMHSDVLSPLLERLTSRLDAMDQQLIDATLTELKINLQSAHTAATYLVDALNAVRSQKGSTRAELDGLARDLRKDIQKALDSIQAERLGQAFVIDYERKLEEIHKQVKDWLARGLGSKSGTKDGWIHLAVGEHGLNQSHGPFANQELHRLRVRVTKAYSQLDEYVNDVLVGRFYQQVCDAVEGSSLKNQSGANRGALFDPGTTDSGSRLRSLISRLEQCDPAVPGLLAAFRSVSDLRFDFRLQSLPLLYELNESMRPVNSHEDQDPYPPDFGKDAVDYMYDWFHEEFIQYSHRVRSALRDDAQRQSNVLRGAAAVLEDEVSRSGTSAGEFRDLVDGFRDELWPGRFNDLNSLSARARHVALAATVLRTAIDQAQEAGE